MTPAGFHEFFAASAGVAGALIGLLFVAISVAHERLNAEDAEQAHRVRADAALTSFVNALTVSLFGLLPGRPLGWTASSVAVIGLLFVAGSLLSLLRVRRSQPGELAEASFLIGLLVVFAVQLGSGVRLLSSSDPHGAVEVIAILVIVCFLVGIARSWELVGGPSIGFRRELVAILRVGRSATDEHEPPADASEPEDRADRTPAP